MKKRKHDRAFFSVQNDRPYLIAFVESPEFSQKDKQTCSSKIVVRTLEVYDILPFLLKRYCEIRASDFCFFA